MLAALLNVNELIEVSGYPLLALLVMAESGGVPVPGETALIVGAVLASQGKLEIGLVIAVAAGAAIVGDNIGYQIGRRGGRWLLQRPGPFLSHRMHVLEIGEPFFARHGPKAVFFGRFILGLRTWASWLAGATHMRWRLFFFWNALGGICWATGVGLIAYFLGRSAGNVFTTFGIYGLVALLLAAVFAFVWRRRHLRMQNDPTADTTSAASDGTASDGAPHTPRSSNVTPANLERLGAEPGKPQAPER